MAVHGPGLGHHRLQRRVGLPRWPRQRSFPLWLALVAASVMALGAVGAWWATQQETTLETLGPAGRHGPGATAGSPPDHYFDMDGGTPSTFPSSRLAIGFLVLDGSPEDAVEAFGPPAETMPDINGEASRWRLAGADLLVSTWADQPDEISGLFLDVPPGSTARFAIFGGVVLGSATLDDVVDAWGDDYTLGSSRYDDFVVRYVACIGRHPIVIKFDQDRVHRLGARSPQWDARVMSMLVAYADEPPGSGGCGP